MKTIFLICTVHEDCGLASASELYSILARLQPEVIFFEAPDDAFHEYIITGTRSNLESISIRRYRQNNDVKVVAVDSPTPEACFFEKLEEFNQRVEAKSMNYRRLMTWNKSDIRDHGFPYLNSEYSTRRWIEIYIDLRATVKIINNQEVTEYLELWERTNDLRENEMMRNIAKYCEIHSFEKAAFLVGAAHRGSIIEKSRVMFCGTKIGIQWDFSYYENQIDGGQA
jgi:hypothetical protein